MAKLAGGALAVVIVALSLWVGGELHYDNCSESANQMRETRLERFRRSLDGRPTRRDRALADCSRLPF